MLRAMQGLPGRSAKPRDGRKKEKKLKDASPFFNSAFIRLSPFQALALFSAVGQIEVDQLLIRNAGFFRLLFEVLGHVGIQADGYLLFEPGGVGILYAL